MLGTALGSALLFVRETTYDLKRTAIEHSHSFLRADRYRPLSFQCASADRAAGGACGLRSATLSSNQVECGSHCSSQRQFSSSGPGAKLMPRPQGSPRRP